LTELDWTKRTEANRIGPNGLKCTEVEGMNQIGPKCYIDVVQNERSYNKCQLLDII